MATAAMWLLTPSQWDDLSRDDKAEMMVKAETDAMMAEFERKNEPSHKVTVK